MAGLKPHRPEYASQDAPATIAQAAKWLQCSEITIRRMIARGELRAYRYGQRAIRIDLSDLQKLRRPVTSIGGDVA